MSLSAYQIWQHKRRGKRYCQAWIMRDNEVIGVDNEPFSTDKFEWGGKLFIRKDAPDLIWNDRDIYIYEYDNALGKVLHVNDALNMSFDCDTNVDDAKKSVMDIPDKDKNNNDVKIGSKIDPSWVSKYVGSHIIEDAIRGMHQQERGVDFMGILMGVIVLILILFVFFG